METDIATAKAKLMTLVGHFTLETSMIDGVKYLRATSNAKIGGLLEVAMGKKGDLHLRKYWGASMSLSDDSIGLSGPLVVVMLEAA
ncbi:MAG: hypothetical protein KOO62_09210 [candidate division Zixibacteria bacterium]|nr:hypothetical protein [candidate division Zixibacteria bacterium]